MTKKERNIWLMQLTKIHEQQKKLRDKETEERTRELLAAHAEE